MSRAPAAALAALFTISCGARLMKLPTVPSGPAPSAVDAGQALAEATARCRALSTVTAEVAASGSVGGRRIPRGRLLVGLAAPSSARIEAPAPFGAPVFIFVASANEATLLLERDHRVLEHGPPAAVLEALTGVPLDPSALRATLTGCVPETDAREARQIGEDWRAISFDSSMAYLHRASGSAPWQLVAVLHRDASVGEWRAEYHDFLNGLPRTIRLTSSNPKQFDLRLELSQVDINVPLEQDAFRVQVPASAGPISLDELRRAGPFGTARSNVSSRR
jgi:hypothetical protein